MKQNSKKSPRHGFSVRSTWFLFINDPDDKVNEAAPQTNGITEHHVCHHVFYFFLLTDEPLPADRLFFRINPIFPLLQCYSAVLIISLAVHR